MSVSKELIDVIKGNDNKGTKPYDTAATVTRVDGSTVWVHIPGGVDETPVKRTVDAKQGDVVQVRVSGGSAWINGNASAPPTDDTTAKLATEYAKTASVAADSAVKSANEASEAAADAKATADSVHGIATQALADATVAKDAADNASEYAARALGNLSTVQSVTETLNWITQHGTMALTTDVALDPTHVYFVVDPLGDYEVGGTHYSVVTEPDVDDIGTYYELTIDESLNNYVGTHLALTSEGLWLIPEVGGNKVLIATGGVGHTYEDAGTYIIDENDNISAQFLEDGTTIYGPSNTIIAHLGYGPGTDSGGGTSDAPYYTLGTRKTTSTQYDQSATYNVGDMCVYDGKVYVCAYDITTPEPWTANHWRYYIGNYSVAEGYDTTASGYCSHAEGWYTTAIGSRSHAEGSGTMTIGSRSHAEGIGTTASGSYSHAEGWDTIASGSCSHAEGWHTIAQRKSQTTIGEYNIVDTSGGETIRGDYAFIIGNGTADNARSNALTVDWEGNVTLALDTTAASGTDHDLYAAITALGWENDVIE